MTDPYTRTLQWARRTFGKPIGQGLWRRVFTENDNFVIKVPFGEWGEYCNDNEALEYVRDRDGILAKCAAFPHPRTGVLLQRMERIVRFPCNEDMLPSWTDWVDSRQVGYTFDGRLVAYDWVYPPPGAHGAHLG